MVDFKAALTNPWVIGGGAALALVLLVANRSSTPADQIVTTGTVSNYSGAEWLAQSAEIAASVNVAEIEARTTERLKLFDVMSGYLNQQATVRGQMSETAAGIAKTRIETEGMLRLDRQQSASRFDEIVKTTDAALTMSQRQADLEELRIRESSNLSRLSIGASLEQAKKTLGTSVTLAKIGAKSEKQQAQAAAKVGVAQARAAEKSGVAQAEAAPWTAFWSGAFDLAGNALRFLPVAGV